MKQFINSLNYNVKTNTVNNAPLAQNAEQGTYFADRIS